MKPKSSRIGRYGFSALLLGAVFSLGLTLHGKRKEARGGPTIEEVIVDQGDEISKKRRMLDKPGHEAGEAAVLFPQETAIRELKQGRSDLIQKAATLEARRKELVAEIEQTRLQQERSGEQQRQDIWSAAEGRRLESFTGSATGRIYPASVIKNVSELGVRVVDSTGHKSIPPEDLPATLREELQFKPVESIGCPSAPRLSPELKELETKWSAMIHQIQVDRKTLQAHGKEVEKIRESIAAREQLTARLEASMAAPQGDTGHATRANVAKLRAKLTSEESKLASLLSQSRKLESRLPKLEKEAASLAAQLEKKRRSSEQGHLPE